MSPPLELGKLGVKRVQTVGCAALHHSDRKTDMQKKETQKRKRLRKKDGKI